MTDIQARNEDASNKAIIKDYCKLVYKNCNINTFSNI